MHALGITIRIVGAALLAACPVEEEDTNATTSAVTTTATTEATSTAESTSDGTSTADPATTAGSSESSADTTAGVGCPPGETCQVAGNGGEMLMVCLAEHDHCVLQCGEGVTCPDSMTCQNNICQYDITMPPADDDAMYPFPEGGGCVDGFVNVSFGPGDMLVFSMCSPACEGLGGEAPCPAGETGTATGACLFNPLSSVMACG